MGEGGSGTTRTRRPPAAAHDRTFSPDTANRIPFSLEEEFPRFATATENFPPEITKDNIRQGYNDHQRSFILRKSSFHSFLFCS